jgi:outer membrane protein
MIKKVLSTATLLLFIVSASAVAQIKIGYMNTQEVLNQLPEREQVQKELNAFIQQKQSELTQKATDYQNEVAEYQSNQASMSAQQIEKREQELTEMQASLQEFDQSIRLQVQQKRDQLLEPILTRVDAAIATIAESENLDFVINKSTNSGEEVIFYASDNQLDITQPVINRLTSSTTNN